MASRDPDDQQENGGRVVSGLEQLSRERCACGAAASVAVHVFKKGETVYSCRACASALRLRIGPAPQVPHA